MAAIKFDHLDIWGFEHAIRGMRNPLRSWDRSDSFEDHILGEADMTLCKKLIKAGPEHRKFLRQIYVSVDISAPRYWWIEFDTYKVGVTGNSESTMHTILKREFTKDDFANDSLVDSFISRTVDDLNEMRKLAVMNHTYWRSLIQMLPQSYIQTRTVTMSYENLMNMYWQRKDHKLKEWREFCEWLTYLPCMKEFLDD